MYASPVPDMLAFGHACFGKSIVRLLRKLAFTCSFILEEIFAARQRVAMWLTDLNPLHGWHPNGGPHPETGFGPRLQMLEDRIAGEGCPCSARPESPCPCRSCPPLARIWIFRPMIKNPNRFRQHIKQPVSKKRHCLTWDTSKGDELLSLIFGHRPQPYKKWVGHSSHHVRGSTNINCLSST